MATRAELRKLTELAYDFANDIRDLLNKTVCNGAVVKAAVVKDADESIMIVGTDLDDVYAARPVPLHIDRKKPKCWLDAQFRCDLDDRGFLRVLSSYFGIYAPDAETPLCHYDYEREKEGYPAAHVQIDGTCSALGALPGPRTDKDLAKLHFPVGGRRYRPTLEDMVEFVVMEGFASGRRGWRKAVNDHRDRFHRIQLRAAVRRMPDVAVEVLREMGEI